jgi:hypothetical protein
MHDVYCAFTLVTSEHSGWLVGVFGSFKRLLFLTALLLGINC